MACRASRRLLVLAWLALVSPALAQLSSTPQSSTDNDARYAVTGSVVDSVTGEPVRRALVQIFAQQQRSTLTDGDGHFEFDGLPEMQTTVNVRKPGYFSEPEINSTPPMVTIGPNSQSVVLKLVPEAIVFGTIQSTIGEPLEHIPVKLIAVRMLDGRKHWETLNATTTNVDGVFRFANLQPGSYYVEAGPSWEERLPNRRHMQNGMDGYPATYHPAAEQVASASPIELAPGQHAQVDFSLKSAPMFRVSGHIAGVSSGQSVNLQFSDPNGEALPFPVDFDPGKGTFQAWVLPGAYELQAGSQGADGQARVGSLPLPVHADMTGLRINLALAVSVPLVTRFEFANSQFVQAARREAPGAGVHLIAAESSIAGNDHWPDAAQNGELAFHNLRPGQYSLAFSSTGPWYIRAAECGGVDLLREKLTISAGVPTPPIEIVLRDDGSILSGTVMFDGHPSQGKVVAVPDRAPALAVQSSAGPDGHFQFNNLPPGDYSVLAFDNTDRLEYTNPDVLGSFLASASRLTLQPVQESEAAVNLIRGAY